MLGNNPLGSEYLWSPPLSSIGSVTMLIYRNTVTAEGDATRAGEASSLALCLILRGHAMTVLL